MVLKLFQQVQPDRAYFGEKDAQQLAVVRRMVRDLDVPVEVIGCATVREDDGLALSSRNVYLSPDERTQALVLSRAVRHVESMIAMGERRAPILISEGRKIFAAEPAVRVDYIEVVDWNTLLPVETAAPGTLFAVAAFVGSTRLIDNMVIG